MILEKKKDIESINVKINMVEKEIFNTMSNPLKKGDIIYNWKNKCKSIKQKEKAIRKLNKKISRINIEYQMQIDKIEAYNFFKTKNIL